MEKRVEFKRTVLPTAGPEDMIRSEAEAEIRFKYYRAGHLTEDYAENFNQRVSEKVVEIAKEIDLSEAQYRSAQHMGHVAVDTPTPEQP